MEGRQGNSAITDSSGHRTKVVLASLIMAGFLALFTEAASFLVCTFVLKRSKLVYAPFDTSQYDEYLEIRDPVLGWPSHVEFGEKKPSGHAGMMVSAAGGYDAKGARISPAFPNSNLQPCVSIYGDSFAWSEEVDAEHAWPNVLAREIQCRVDNFGVRGYGTDQAYLRYRQNVTAGNERAPIVVLTVLTENVMRNVNQYRYFLNATDALGLKPRFILERDGSLKLVALPTFSHSEFDRALRDPAAFFRHEFFLPGSKRGLVWLGFPYSRTVVGVFFRLLFIARAKLAGLPLHYPFYEPGDRGHAVELTAAIVAQFHDDVVGSGRKFFAVIIPTGYELRYYRRHHLWVQQRLVEALVRRHIALIRFGPEVLERITTSDPCSIYTACGQHLNQHGYALLAGIVQQHLAASPDKSSPIARDFPADRP